MKTLAASVRQLLEYTEGQGTLRWQQLTFEPSAKRRRRLEPRTFWTELALRQFVQKLACFYKFRVVTGEQCLVGKILCQHGFA